MKGVLQQTFSVPFQYQVLFTEGLFREDNPLMANLIKAELPSKVLFVLDGGLAAAHPLLHRQLETYTALHRDTFAISTASLLMPGGEEVKNSPEHLQTVLEAINRWCIDRHSYVVGIGGGAVLDMVGFAAAVAHRGIRYIRVPTTVLSQNDSGVGVKNSINAFGKKNFLGTFAPRLP